MSEKVLIPNNPTEEDLRTRDHIQKVAILLNDLLRNGYLILGSDGTYTVVGGAASLEGAFFGRIPATPDPRLDSAGPVMAGEFFTNRAIYGQYGA